MIRTLTRNQLKARVLRALSGLPQEDFERETRVENIAGIENGSHHLTPAEVAQMCPRAGLTPEGCERLIQEYEAEVAREARRRAEEDSRGPARRPVPEPGTSIAGLIEELEARISGQGGERSARRAAERELARDSWGRAKGLGSEDVVLLARATREYRSWALVERICDESRQAGGRAADLAGLAVEIAGHVRGSEGWCRRLRGFALAHLASARNALDTAGDPGARETFAEAESLWKSGEDPDQILDAGRFRSLKASLKTRQAYPA